MQTKEAAEQVAKHTPGQWHQRAETNYGPAQIYGGGDARPILLADIYGDSREERASNARLIAASPDLLESLKWFVADTMRDGSGDDAFWASVERAKAAIAKAEGK